MTRKPRKSERRAASVLAMLLSAAALLALAVPGMAHDSGDHPSFHDDDPAGQIASFDADTGMLVIDLIEGGSVAGLVTRRTWIKIDGSHDPCARRHLSSGGDHDWCHRHLRGSGSGGGDHRGWWHGGGRGDTDDLVPGATVEDALLVLKDGRAFFWKVELED
jgi:hypothetical protein